MKKKFNRKANTEANIEITNGLKFIRDPLGAILQFVAKDADIKDVFAVGMSKESLRKGWAAIGADAISWRMNDGSLIVTGGKDEVVLTFAAMVPGVKPKSIALRGAELVAFKSALEKLAK